jgi:hypothetical protein
MYKKLVKMSKAKKGRLKPSRNQRITRKTSTEAHTQTVLFFSPGSIHMNLDFYKTNRENREITAPDGSRLHTTDE